MINPKQPIVSSIVLYVLNTGPNMGTPRPAIVTSITEQTVNLYVFAEEMDWGDVVEFQWNNVTWDPLKMAGTWHWPDGV